MRARALILFLWLSLSLLGCPRKPDPHGPPRLVVVVVLDQVGSWILDRHLPILPSDGLVARVRSTGAFHHRTHLDYAATITAVGHAAIFTGKPPRESGIVANQVWDPARGKVVAILDDGKHRVLGVDGRFSSPEALTAEGVADVLRARFGDRTHVVSLSGKERGAVIPGGRQPDVALWYEARARGLTTSSYYASKRPRWLTRWQRKHPTQSFFAVWRPLDAGRLAALAGPDDGPGEGDFRGLGTTFPHDLPHVPRPYEAILATPSGSQLLLAAARRAVKSYDLGEDDVPDLLTLSVSGTDYAGHVWGPSSWEMADNLVRVDRMLGDLYRWLAQRGPVAVLVTADHGGPPLPESPLARGTGAGRILEEELLAAADHGIDEALGPGDWVQEYLNPYLYLRPAALERRSEAVPAAIAAVARLPGIAAAVDVARLQAATEAPADAIERAVWRSVQPGRGGEIFVVPAEGTILGDGTPPRSGSDHGTPWDCDAEVPVLMVGAGVRRIETRERWPQDRVAATIAALLGVPAPRGAPREPLPGLSRPRKSAPRQR